MTTPKRKRFGTAESTQIEAALAGQELWPYSSSGDPERNFWREAREVIEEHYSSSQASPLFAVPASSGTAAIHVALGGLRIPAGSEVIVPPISDMGTVMPVIFQNAIPIFADVDPESGLVTAETIAAAMTERTSAVIVVHLTGSPADMDPILELCQSNGIKVIEDAAQALGATYKGSPAGTLGDAGCFSLNSQKHITCGEGGFVLVRSEDDFLRCLNFSDKHRNRTRSNKEEHATYAGPGLNYRMSDLELAMVLAQVPKLKDVAARFTATGRRLDERLEKIAGVQPQRHHQQAVPSYFFHMFRLDPELLPKRESVYLALREAATSINMRAGKSYGRETLYHTKVFQNRNFFAFSSQAGESDSIWPAEVVARQQYPNLPEDYFHYQRTCCPEAEKWIGSALSVYFHDAHTPDHADIIADSIEVALGY